ncbi:hypothetical protein N9A89_04125 [Akkermansiaceae bacterium]|nr:hypothetical protein [Akkermansiaceae bacterium]
MKALLVLLASACFVGAIVHEAHQIHQPISLHGTDVSEDFKGEPVQAKVTSFLTVTVGAMPEALVAAVASPHKLSGPKSYTVPEANLLVLCGIRLDAEMGEKGLTCTFDLKDLKVPDEIDLPIRTILELSMKSLRNTLQEYYKGAKMIERVLVKVIGTTDKNASLKDLSTTFKVGK